LGDWGFDVSRRWVVVTSAGALVAATAVVAAAAIVGAVAVPAGASSVPPPSPPGATRVPDTVLLDGARLAGIRASLAHNPSAALSAALHSLTKSAAAELTAGPWSVMDKNQTPPSGSKHDYLSQAPYWWPSAKKTTGNPQGCPYVQKDGQRNPEADQISDHAEQGKAWTAIRDLALAWYYTGDARYATRAELDARTWFINAATRMNPNLTYAQVIPCDSAVHGTGIIDASEALPQLLDGFALLDSGAPGWSASDTAAIKSWLGDLLTWSRTSPQGMAETAAANNHGTYKDLMDSSIAVYIGQTALAQGIVSGARAARIDRQISGDGSQPLELARTRSWHYSNFDVTAYCRLTATGRRAGVNLWAYVSPRGGSIDKAIDFLIPAAEKGRGVWKGQELGSFDQTLAKYALHFAADNGDAAAAAALPKVPSPAGGDLWPVEPAC
jgi:hypothetical protein